MRYTYNLNYSLRDINEYSRKLDMVAEELCEELEEVLDYATYSTGREFWTYEDLCNPVHEIIIPLVYGFYKSPYKQYRGGSNTIPSVLIDKMEDIIRKRPNTFRNYTSFVITPWIRYDEYDTGYRITYDPYYDHDIIKFRFEDSRVEEKRYNRQVTISDFIENVI